MAAILFVDWGLEVDSVATRRAQAAGDAGSPEACGCLHCRNFIAARQVAYPREFRELLGQLGIPEGRESEIYHCGEIEPGRYVYGGWFHFIGRIVTGPEAFVGLPSGGNLELREISERFSVGFTRSLALVPDSFPPGEVGQLEFMTKVPWLLDEPPGE